MKRRAGEIRLDKSMNNIDVCGIIGAKRLLRGYLWLR
jgi:hypothetical protein